SVLFISDSRHHPEFPSFPTRRSSDLLGGILVIGEVHGTLNKVILTIAIAFGTINVVGGFLVTDRMLEMFKARPKPAAAEKDGERSEEHTSEPQSRSDLVCRLLLEKKK